MSAATPTALPSPDQPEHFYKFLSADQVGRYSGKRLPIGEWIRVEGPLRMCANGIHVTTIEYATKWLDDRAHLVEIRGEHIVGDEKLCCREVYIHPALPGWSRETLIRFAADCAERVLHIFEAKYPNDDRPREAIEVARSGDAQRARTADYAADYSAAAAAAAAAYSAAAADAAAAAAYSAAAAYAATTTAADDDRASLRSAARESEREWQRNHLSALMHGGAE